MEVKLIQATSLDGIIAGYRECYQSQDKGDDLGEKDQKLISRALFDSDPRHDSPTEHCLYTWRVSGVSRALSHQLVRHRIASYSQRSQRYVNEKQFEYVTPNNLTGKLLDTKREWYPTEEEYIKQKAVHDELKIDAEQVFFAAMKSAQKFYEDMIACGVPKEDARMVLPNACCTSLIMSMNPRAFRNFLKLRLDTHAQWEIRALAKLMLDSVPEDHKFLYQDFLNEGRNKTEATAPV